MYCVTTAHLKYVKFQMWLYNILFFGPGHFHSKLFHSLRGSHSLPDRLQGDHKGLPPSNVAPHQPTPPRICVHPPMCAHPWVVGRYKCGMCTYSGDPAMLFSVHQPHKRGRTQQVCVVKLPWFCTHSSIN